MRISILPLVLLAAAACGKADHNATAGGTGASTAAMSRPAASAELSERAADSIQAAGVPTAVADIGTRGEDLYDMAKASDWTKARAIMDSLSRSVSALTPEQRAQIAKPVDSLRNAIAAQQRQAALVAANRVTYVAAGMTEAYHPKMPADIVRLDYYGRELEIWAAQKDLGKLQGTAADLRRTWDAVKPTEISHGGASAAAKTDSLVARLTVAKTVADYARLATPILDVVDELEKPFEK